VSPSWVERPGDPARHTHHSPYRSSHAQGGGASATGTIQGRVADTSGAVLPGVTVTASSPSMLGVQTTVTSENGNYRFPAVPPGTYTITYELPGFNTVRREGIQITLGFTANINIELALATLEETVTVTGESPVIDTTATRVVQNFKLDQLQSIPNGRDMWSLLAVTPAVQMTRIDVGGNRAGTQTGYTAYGFTGQVRVLIEGINTTEGTGGAGFYFDYSSLEEVFLGTSGQSAEMPNPGVQSQFIAKSGGNMFSGEGYVDWYNNSLQGSNIPADTDRARHPRGQQRDRPLLRHGAQRGRPDRARQGVVVRDLPDAEERGGAAELQLRQDVRHEAVEPGRQGHLSGEPEQQADRVLPVGPEGAADRLPFADGTYDSPEQTFAQDSGSWVWKGEWNGTLSDKLYVEARVGSFGYYFPLITNSDEPSSGATRATLAIRTARTSVAARPRAQPVHGGGHLLPRLGARQPHDQGRRRDAARAGLGRPRAGVRRQHRPPLQQRRLEPGDLLAADGDERREPEGREEGRPHGAVRR
jgi:hypothetical protein